MQEFTSKLEIIGINPFVFIPEPILNHIFIQAGKNKGNIPVRGTVNEIPFTQTLLKYNGEWRLYINLKMLPNSPKRIGETITLKIAYDNSDRTIEIHPKLLEALNSDNEAKNTFESLKPSLQKEIIKYITFLKSEESIQKNIKLAIGFLKGENKFLTRQPIKND